MTLGIQVLSAHPWAGLYLAQVLASDPTLARRLANPPVIGFDSLPRAASPRLFVVDTYFIPVELPQLNRLLRVRSPGSRFAVLLPAQSFNDETCLRLLYLGIEGVVGASDALPQELPAAVHAVSGGDAGAEP